MDIKSYKQTKAVARERRKYPRFQPKNKVYSSIKYKAEYIVGEVIDLSKGGMSLKYLYEMHPILAKSNGSSYDIEIFSKNGEDFLIEGLKCNIVYTTFMPKEPISSLRMVRCGLKFTHLNHETIKKVDELIAKTAT